MAPRLAANERSEREFQADVSQAVANTEAEIFDDATGSDELDNDGDQSLEEMGTGLEGGDEEVDAEEAGDQDESDEEGDAQSDAGDESGEGEGDAEEAGEDEGEETEAEDDERDAPRGRERQRDAIRGVAPGVHREERHRRREAEDRAARFERELAETRGRLEELSRQVTARPAAAEKQPEREDPEPDMFADPEGWKAWNRRQAEKVADERIDRALGGFRQEQQQERISALNDNLMQTARGPEGFMFQAAYDTLTSLDPRDPANRRLVTRLTSSPDPGKAILDWFEDNGADEFRAQLAEQLGFDPDEVAERQQRGRGNGSRNQQRRGAPQRQGAEDSRQRPQQQPRRVFRMPVSLNGTRGAGRQNAITDPDMLNDSDASVFDFATRPSRATRG